MTTVTLASVIDQLKNLKMTNNETKCGICSMILSPEDIIRLSCEHEYHYGCIKDWYKKIVNNSHGSASSKNKECPYCRKPGGYLPLKKGEKYDKDIHSPKHSIKIKTVSKSAIVKINSSHTSTTNGCKATTKANTPCKVKVKENNDGFCHHHCKKYLNSS